MGNRVFPARRTSTADSAAQDRHYAVAVRWLSLYRNQVGALQRGGALTGGQARLLDGYAATLIDHLTRLRSSPLSR